MSLRKAHVGFNACTHGRYLQNCEHLQVSVARWSFKMSRNDLLGSMFVGLFEARRPKFARLLSSVSAYPCSGKTGCLCLFGSFCACMMVFSPALRGGDLETNSVTNEGGMFGPPQHKLSLSSRMVRSSQGQTANNWRQKEEQSTLKARFCDGILATGCKRHQATISSFCKVVKSPAVLHLNRRQTPEPSNSQMQPALPHFEKCPHRQLKT